MTRVPTPDGERAEMVNDPHARIASILDAGEILTPERIGQIKANLHISGIPFTLAGIVASHEQLRSDLATARAAASDDCLPVIRARLAENSAAFQERRCTPEYTDAAFVNLLGDALTLDKLLRRIARAASPEPIRPAGQENA